MNKEPMNIFDKIVFFLDHTEVSFVTLLAKIIPVLVPIIPAYVGFVHVTDKVSGLGFDPWAGWIYGAVIEGLGYAAIYRAVQFWEHNRKYTDEKNHSPLFVAIGIYVVYLIVTLTVNVVLDYKSGVVLYKVFALGLISFLSVPAGLLMSISAIHTERTTARKQANERKQDTRTNNQNERGTNKKRTNARSRERTPERTPNRQPQPAPVNERKNSDDQPFGFPANEGKKEMRLNDYIDQLERNGEPVPGPSELARRLKMSKSHISERMKKRREG